MKVEQVFGGHIYIISSYGSARNPPDNYRMRINSNLIYIILCNIKRAV